MVIGYRFRFLYSFFLIILIFLYLSASTGHETCVTFIDMSQSTMHFLQSQNGQDSKHLKGNQIPKAAKEPAL